MKNVRGFSLLEVLITILILAFGLLGLAGLQAHTMNTEMESYQRSQALVLLNDMASRLESNVSTNGSAYSTATPLGTGQSEEDCSGKSGVERDHCEWSNMLLGVAETGGSGSVGAMIGARGCIREVQAANPATGVCTPGIYEIAVTWQGMYETFASQIECGKGLYGDDKLRRVVSMRILTATTSCTPT